MMNGTALVCLLGSLVLPHQAPPAGRLAAVGGYEFDLLGRFNPDNREQRLEQYKAIRLEVERARAKLSWSEEEVRQFASERGLSFVHGVVPKGRENELTMPAVVLGAVLWKEGAEPPAKGKVIRVEARLITGGDDKELLRRFRNTRTLMQDQGFQEAYGYDHNHFQRLIGSLPAEKLAPVLRGLNKEAAGKNADFAPVALLIAGEEASFSPEMKPVPPEGILRKIPPDSRSIFGEMAAKAVEGARAEGEAAQPAPAQTAVQPATPVEPVRLEVVLNRVVPLTVGEETRDLPWWNGLGEGAILEGRIGPLLSVRVTPNQAIKIASQSDVAVVRLPRDAVRVQAGTAKPDFPRPVGLPLDARSNVAGARPDFRSPLVVVVHDDFRGWETNVPRAQLLDLTRERNSLFKPDPVPGAGAGIGDGTRIASILAERSGGTRIILARIDAKSPAMLGRILQAMRGGALQEGLLGIRTTEVSTELARLNGLQQRLLDEQESLFLNAEGDTDAVVRRKGEVREALEKNKADLLAANHLDRELRFHRGHLLELAQTSVVLSGLAWAEGHPLDGSAVLSRYLDDALAKKIIWFQAAPDLSAAVWSGAARDANHNRLLEFDARVAPEKAHGAEFLPLAWGQGSDNGAKLAGATRSLAAPATIRLTLQWRESVRAELVQNYPQYLEEPIRTMRLLVVRKGDGEGGDTLWTPVGTADGVAQKILQEPHSATWEQQLTLNLDEPGEYAVQVEGSPPRNTMPDQLGATPGSTFTPITPMRILCRTLKGAPVSLAYSGVDPFDTPGWLPVPSQARRAMTVATRPATQTDLALEPDRRAKPEMVVPATGATQVLEVMAEAGAEVVRKMGRGDSPELIDWVMHRRMGWLPAAGLVLPQPAKEMELGQPTREGNPR